jgi:hypothetical protein
LKASLEASLEEHSLEEHSLKSLLAKLNTAGGNLPSIASCTS